MDGTGKITVSLPSDVIAALKKAAETEDRPVSVVVRRALDAYLRRKGK